MTPIFSRDYQALDNPAIDQMFFDDLVNIIPVHIGIPDILGVYDDDRPFFTTIETTRCVDPHPAPAGKPKLLAALLGIVAHCLRIKMLATCAAISPFIGTEEYVITIVGHHREDTG